MSAQGGWPGAGQCHLPLPQALATPRRLSAASHVSSIQVVLHTPGPALRRAASCSPGMRKGAPRGHQLPAQPLAPRSGPPPAQGIIGQEEDWPLLPPVQEVALKPGPWVKQEGRHSERGSASVWRAACRAGGDPASTAKAAKLCSLRGPPAGCTGLRPGLPESGPSNSTSTF